MSSWSLVSLNLTGSALDPDEVTARTGLVPTMTFHVGQPVGETGRRRKTAMWRLTVRGPTTAHAPEVPGELAASLLEMLRGREELFLPFVESGSSSFLFDLSLPSLMTFSFELDASTVAHIARLGGITLRLRYEGDDTPPHPFDSSEGKHSSSSASILIMGPELDPAEVGSVLGLSATRGLRKGDRLDSRDNRIAWTGIWELQNEAQPPEDTNVLLGDLLERFPGDDAWLDLGRRYTIYAKLSYIVAGLSGFIELDRTTVERVAQLGTPLSFWFGDYGG